jgi:glycerophosphoryl diester phosphodiesterase
MNIYLDFKDADVRQTMEALRKFHFEKSVLVYINAEAQYRDWKKYFPQVPVIVSLPDEARDVKAMETFLAKYPAEVLDGDWDGYTPEMVSRARTLGIKVWPDIQSPTEEGNWPKALALGLDGLQTDHPGQLSAWLKAHRRR